VNRWPARIIPLLYVGTAHVSLALACFLVGWSPRAVAGFFYHSWMIAIVHLVTLGWITSSILGAIYIVAPATLGMPLPARRGDYVAFALVIIGIVGMVAHFWIAEFGGMAWSAATVTTGIAYVAGRMVRGLPRAPVPGGVKLHIALAAANLLIAATAGILLGFDKVYHFLPGFILSNVFAHAHLAAIGWATMMVVGIGYRMLPMVLPAQAPAGWTLYASALLLEAGVLTLFAGLVLRAGWAAAGAVLVVAGLGCAAAHVGAMVRHPKRRPAAAPRVDFAVLHAASAGVSLAITCGLGLFLVFAPPSESGLRIALVYGVTGLVGFLAQIVIGMQGRLLAMFAWYHAMAGSGFRGPILPPYGMHNRSLQELVFAGWTFAVPALAVGFAMNAIPLLAAGAWTLFGAVVLSGAGNARVVWRVIAGFPAPGVPDVHFFEEFSEHGRCSS
jgi:hypothetical protein